MPSLWKYDNEDFYVDYVDLSTIGFYSKSMVVFVVCVVYVYVDFHPLVPFLPQAYRLKDKEAQIRYTAQ